MSAPNLLFIRPELAQILRQYYIIRDCVSGTQKVKARGIEYLPMPNPDDKTKRNKLRYERYLKRAVYYNATGRTLSGLVGHVFMRTPVSEIPDEMDAIEINASGSGISLEQSAEATLAYTLSYGRSGILVDYPNTGGNVTAKETAEGLVRPTITTYDPFSIINWRTKTVGSVTKLTLVVLAETWPYHDDGFEIKTALQVRVLYLNADGKYSIDTWREAEASATDWAVGDAIPQSLVFQTRTTDTPQGPDGEPFDEIPFMFVGVRNNDSSIDNPPLSDLAELNLSHYRNSADYEEAAYIMGQPTYVFMGVKQSWYEEVMKKEVALGSVGGVILNEGADAKLLQPAPNTMVKEAMDQKERQMVALGAKLVQESSVQRTATEAKAENASETSILASAAKNVSFSYVWALKWCAKWMGIEWDDEANKYELNSNFELLYLAPEQLKQLVAMWQQGATTFGEMRSVLRKAGLATEDDKTAQQVIEKDQTRVIQNTEAAMTLGQGGNPDNNGGGNA